MFPAVSDKLGTHCHAYVYCHYVPCTSSSCLHYV